MPPTRDRVPAWRGCGPRSPRPDAEPIPPLPVDPTGRRATSGATEPLAARRPDAATAGRLARAIAAAGDVAALARLEDALLRACGWEPRPPDGPCFLNWGRAPDGSEVLRGTEPRPLTDTSDARALAGGLADDLPDDLQDDLQDDPPAIVAAALERLAARP